MAFGFAPKHQEIIQVADLSKNQLLALANEVIVSLNWSISSVGQTFIVAYSKMSLSSMSEEIEVRVQDQSITIKSTCTGNQLYDWGKNKKNTSAFLEGFEKAKATYSTEDLDRKFEELSGHFTHPMDDHEEAEPPTAIGQFSDFLSLFIPKKGYLVTPILFAVNVLIFLAMVVSGVSIMAPDSESLLFWGANFRPLTAEGEWWRLLTSCFLHIGILHLIFNMYALIYIGMLLEPLMGSGRFLLSYLLVGIAASATSLYWHDLTISAGASGAIFGMYGVFLAMLSTQLIERAARNTFLTSILVFVGYNLMNGMKEGVDNAAHIGGLIFGLVAGYLFYPALKNPKNSILNYFASFGLAGIVIATSIFALNSETSSDLFKFEEGMNRFAGLEEQALEVFNLPNSTSDQAYLDEISMHGIPAWESSIALLDSLDQLDVPEHLKERNSILIDYCSIRIQSYETIYRAISENSGAYEKDINRFNEQIDSIIGLLQ